MQPPFASGIYAILDLGQLAQALPTDPDEELEFLQRYVQDAVDAGVVAIQLRAKDVPAQSLWLPLLISAVATTIAGRIPLIINDHLPPIETLGTPSGVGLHLGQQDDTPQYARSRLGDNVLLGVSTHSLEQVAAAQDVADYIGYGPVKETGSKSNPDPVVGITGLCEAVTASGLPVVAIGGLQVEDMADVVASGARCAAVIGAWLGDATSPNRPNFARMAIKDLVTAWRKAKRSA